MEIKNNKNIYDLNLNEITFITSCNYYVTRVPGGWIYRDNSGNIFIPFDNSFQHEKNS